MGAGMSCCGAAPLSYQAFLAAADQPVSVRLLTTVWHNGVSWPVSSVLSVPRVKAQQWAGDGWAHITQP
jgi:hypothetical protein